MKKIVLIALSILTLGVVFYSGMHFGSDANPEGNQRGASSSPPTKDTFRPDMRQTSPGSLDPALKEKVKERKLAQSESLIKDPLMADFFATEGIAEAKALEFQKALIESAIETSELFIDEATGLPMAPDRSEMEEMHRNREKRLVAIVGRSAYEAYNQYTLTFPIRMGIERARSSGVEVPSQGVMNQAITEAQATITPESFSSAEEYGNALSERVISSLSEQGEDVGSVSSYISEAIQSPAQRKLELKN